MDSIVCIKQVPDTTEIKINPETNTLVRDGVASIINPFDMYAIEEGLRLRERFGGTVTVVTMGPPQAKESLKEAVSLGVDTAVLVSDRAFAGSDTLATSLTLAQAIKKIGRYDLIICGKQAIDGDTAQVGPGIAVHLDIAQCTYVKKIEEHSAKTITVDRMTEEGYDRVKVTLPALITVVKEINEPRMPSIKGKIRSKSYEPEVFTSADFDIPSEMLGLSGSPTVVDKIFSPPPKTGGKVIHGESDHLADELAGILREMGVV